MQNPADVLNAAPRTIAAALLTALVACGGDGPSATARDTDAGALPVPPGCPTCTFGDVAVAGTIQNPAIAELSGLAASRRHPDVLYTHNDSGDRARFFAIGTDGDLLSLHVASGRVARTRWETRLAHVSASEERLFFATAAGAVVAA